MQLSGKRLNSGNRASKNQRMNVVRAFIGVDRFEVDHVADDAEVLGDTVAAVHELHWFLRRSRWM